jgi:hypothetical protein
MKTIHIIHLYPKEMNIYGDNGNLLVLQKRLSWRNLPVKVSQIGVGQVLPSDTHLIIGGGGQDAGQALIAKDLQQKAKTLRLMQKDGIPMLMICGMYQMFGHYFKTSNNELLPGIGLLDARTVAGENRIIGNITVRTKDWGTLVGYENHSGQTTLGDQAQILGEVPNGQGNNGEDCSEGARQAHVIGSYLHGPLLAKAPLLADYLLSLAASLAGFNGQLKAFDNNLEHQAAQIAAQRPR